MDRAQLLIAVIGSAAVGALISSLIMEIGKWRERRSRREELVLTKAAEMAHTHVKIRMDNFKDSNTRGLIAPDIVILEEYYKSLKHLLEKSELDPEMQTKVAAVKKKLGICTLEV